MAFIRGTIRFLARKHFLVLVKAPVLLNAAISNYALPTSAARFLSSYTILPSISTLSLSKVSIHLNFCANYLYPAVYFLWLWLKFKFKWLKMYFMNILYMCYRNIFRNFINAVRRHVYVYFQIVSTVNEMPKSLVIIHYNHNSYESSIVSIQIPSWVTVDEPLRN